MFLWTEQKPVPQTLKKPQSLGLIWEKHMEKDQILGSKNKKSTSYTLYPTKQLTSNSLIFNEMSGIICRGTWEKLEKRMKQIIFYGRAFSWNDTTQKPSLEILWCTCLSKKHIFSKRTTFSTETKIFQNNSNWIFYSPAPNPCAIWRLNFKTQRCLGFVLMIKNTHSTYWHVTGSN